MKSLPIDMIALHIQAELPALLGAPEHKLQHCWGNCMHCCRNTFTQVLQIPNLHLVHLSLDVTPCREVQGIWSLERAAHNRGEPRPIHRPGNVLLR